MGVTTESYPSRLQLAAHHLHDAPLLWPFFNNNWPLLTALFRTATRAMLRHDSGGAVVHHYYDHPTQQYRQQTLSQEEMTGRCISHIPAKHFKMVRYYGFLSNRKRGELLPKVYDALEMEEQKKPEAGRGDACGGTPVAARTVTSAAYSEGKRGGICTDGHHE